MQIVLSSVYNTAPLEFFLIFCGCVACVLCLRVLARERSGAAVGLKVLGRAFVTADLHDA